MSGVYEVRTRSGSKYLVDTVNKTVHRVCGGKHYAGRADVPTKYEELLYMEVGRSMFIYWGPGRDPYSPDDGMPDEDRQRATQTSQVTSITEL